MTLSENDYLALCEFNSLFKKIGKDNFEPKIWLVFVALKNGTVSQESVALHPCQSLMKHGITYDQIGWFLSELQNNGILNTHTRTTYSLFPQMAFELHKICYDLSLKINNVTVLTNIVHECGYPSNAETNVKLSRFESGGDNEKTEVIKELLSQIAYSGTEFILKCISNFKW